MKEQYKVARSFGLAAAATTIVGAVGMVPAEASPPPASSYVADDVLTIRGTSNDDRITVDFTSPDSVGVDVGSGRQGFARNTFDSIAVYLGSGDDRLRTVTGGTSLTDVPLAIHGGAGDDEATGGAASDVLSGDDGDDRLLGGAGTDVVFGGRGSDFVNGQAGTDTELLGQGDDSAAWNPGDGNDAIFGGRGADSLIFNGSDGDELMSLSANGDRAVFLRNLGAIRMDLDGIERVHVVAFGGADSVTIGDLSGTDVDTAEVDLSAAAGGGDAKADTVVVNGSDRNDTVDVAAHDGAVSVSGLAAETLVSGNEPTDRLKIDTFGGFDSVTVANQAASLINIAVDLGTGQS